jgi:hypothetical protein
VARYWCERCGAEANTLDSGHVCKDVAARLKRRERQVEAVMDILLDAMDGYGDARPFAEAIVAKLAGMGVTDD